MNYALNVWLPWEFLLKEAILCELTHEGSVPVWFDYWSGWSYHIVGVGKHMKACLPILSKRVWAWSFKIPKLTLWSNTLHRNDEPRHLLQNAKAFITELKGALPMTSRVSCTEFGQRKWTSWRKAPDIPSDVKKKKVKTCQAVHILGLHGAGQPWNDRLHSV